MEEVLYSYLYLFPTYFLIAIIALMLYTLSKGADMVVDEAVSLSLHLGVSKLIIGATIVSLGTTLPEASVSVLAAINGNPDLALGNAIGSIIADTGLIIGIAAFIGYLPVQRYIVERQGKIQLYSGVLLAAIALPFISGGRISQFTGWTFILLLMIYLYVSIKWARKSNSELEHSDIPQADPPENNSLAVKLLKLSFGIFTVIVSSKILIPSVEITAMRIGIPQSIIAATLVAFGTSLPELVTAITAVKKGHGELAVGNIVGADILNVLFVIGAAAAVTGGGLYVPPHFYKLQFPAMLIILSTFRFFSRGENEMITTKEGLTLFSIYCIYLLLNFIWI